MTTRTEPIVVVELDIPRCSLTYGTAPCTAALGVTGEIKCFNGRRTCQDLENFAEETLTVTFSQAHAETLLEDAIPALLSASSNGCVIDPGKSMGQRATVKVSIADFQDSDAGFDKYRAERGYDAYNRGTFWPRMRARLPSFEGIPLRVKRGYADQPLADYSVEHYVIDSLSSDVQGVTISAKDALSLCDAKKSQAPEPSTGRLLADIDADDLSLTLTPTGVGNAEYPSTGYVCLSGKEVVGFSRSGDVLTISRGEFGTTARDHREDAAVQLCLVYDSESAADIIYDLFTEYTAGFDAAWADLPAWQTEVDTYVGFNYSACVPAPTSTSTLVNELIEQAGLAVWFDVSVPKVMLQSLRPVVPGALLVDDSVMVGGTLNVKDQPDQRVSMSLTYYGVVDPTNKSEKESNFAAAHLTVDSETEGDYTTPALRKTFSRWIPGNSRPAASRLNDMLLSRFKDAPRALSFDLFPTFTPMPTLGQGVYASSAVLQDATGAAIQMPVFITSVEASESRIAFEGVEFRFSDASAGNARTLIIDSDVFNVNLWELYLDVYGSAPSSLELTVYIYPGVHIGSTDPDEPAFYIPDDFPALATVTVYQQAGAKVLGAGGIGDGYSTDAEDGGDALVAERAVTWDNLGTIGGGGGGGGRIEVSSFGSMYFVGGGGGAGYNRRQDGARVGGAPGAYYGAAYGNTSNGGAGATTEISYGGDPSSPSLVRVYAGDGGNLGQAGEVPYAPAGMTAGPAGAAGNAVNGDSFITFTTEGTILGARVG